VVHHRRHMPRRDRTRRAAPCGHRGHRHHQPARDDPGLGPRHRRTDAQRHRLAGPPHRRHLPRAAERRQRGRGDAPHRASARPLFLGHQAEVDARQSRGRARRARRGELLFGTVDSYLDLEADGRAAPCDRRDERRAHASLRHPAGLLEPRALRASRHADGNAARGAGLRRRLRHHAARPVRPGDPDPRGGGRPAGGHAGPGLFHARHGEIDLWHRVLCRSEHRATRCAKAATACSAPSPTSSTAGRPMPWKGRSSSRARSSSGCATGSRSSARPGRRRRSPRPPTRGRT
jgi:hypothetical protein